MTKNFRQLVMALLLPWTGCAATSGGRVDGGHRANDANAGAGTPTAVADQLDRLAVRDLIDRASDAINHRDWPLLATFFTDDASWEAAPPVDWKLEGLPAILGFLTGNASKVEVLFYTVASSAVQLEDAGHASARSTMSELLHLKETDKALHLVGTYSDQFLKKDGSWKFRKRRFQLRFEDDVPLPARLSSRAAGSSVPRAPQK